MVGPGNAPLTTIMGELTPSGASETLATSNAYRRNTASENVAVYAFVASSDISPHDCNELDQLRNYGAGRDY